mgnify:CR=1 FL=1
MQEQIKLRYVFLIIVGFVFIVNVNTTNKLDNSQEKFNIKAFTALSDNN